MRRLVRASSFALCLATATALLSPRLAHADEASAKPELSPLELREARAEVEATRAQMRAVSLRVREHLRVTRKRGTKVQITCVDEALSRSDVASRRAREVGDELLAAYARADLEAARAARQHMAELREAQRLAARDGGACSAAFVQVATMSSTTVKVEVDPRIPRVP